MNELAISFVRDIFSEEINLMGIFWKSKRHNFLEMKTTTKRFVLHYRQEVNHDSENKLAVYCSWWLQRWKLAPL